MDNFNFNSIRFNASQTNTQAGLVKGFQDIANMPNTSQIQAQGQNLPAFQNAQNVPILDYSMLSVEIPKMEYETVLKYLQNMLNLPNSMDKFIGELKNPDSQFIKLLVENLISTKALGEFLNTNSKEAILKVLETISTSLKSGIKDVGDLKEILSFLNAIQVISKDPNNNSLKEFLLLYIPLSVPVFEKKLEFSGLSSEAQKEIDDSDLSILFETKNFSNMLIVLNDATSGVLVDIYSNKDFPKEKFYSVLKQSALDASIKILAEFKEIKTENKGEKAQNFSIISSDFITPNVLLIAHIIIKTIIKIDDDFETI